MPELPEVETVGRALAPHLIGRTIHDTEVRQTAFRTKLDPVHFATFFEGETIDSWQRHGKYLIFSFFSGKRFVLHLGMSGSCRVCDGTVDFERHEHLAWNFTDGSSWRYSDIRRFGQLFLIESGEELPASIRCLGPDALSDDCSGDYLKKRLSGQRAEIKCLLLNQRILAGVGNIYACEALWRAGISPFAIGDKLTKKRLIVLVEAIKQVLRESVSCGGTTIRDFRRPDGSEGKFVLHLDVYGRDGEACSRCGSSIVQVMQHGRSTWYCPCCQKER